VQITFQSGVRDSVIIDPLWDTINLTSCSYNVKSTKISLTMRKAITITWKDLKGSFPTGITSDRSPQISYPPASSSAVPSYPTSSRSGAKDWDKITSDLTEKTTDSGKEDKGQESEDEDDEGVDGFFKKLYAKADPETQRAMIKSFTESQGTSLSTNWSQVSQGKVERHE
jgi:suppressor of G2 allele of SKP1